MGVIRPSWTYFSAVPVEAPAARENAAIVSRLFSSLMRRVLYNESMRSTGNSVFRGEVLGAAVDLHPVGGVALTRRGVLHVLQDVLDIGDRQARAAVSSYMSEGWALRTYNGGLNELIFEVGSLEVRARTHLERRDESKGVNGRRGGRPRKDVETVVAAAQQERGVLLKVSGPGA